MIDPTKIKKCERCVQMEQLADGYRIALIESAKLLQFVLLPTTTDAERAEIRQKAFDMASEPSEAPKAPPAPPSAS